ncbi:hypothetical protein JTB14_023725 [Gonioctena quinquepunctata]|nr:hypothetical protein JTB14_023725 [Gonioctena quinquepunctata]
MENLLHLLVDPPSEEKKLRIIRNNLLPSFQSHLALVATLTKRCPSLEGAAQIQGKFHSLLKSVSSSEPTLAFDLVFHPMMTFLVRVGLHARFVVVNLIIMKWRGVHSRMVVLRVQIVGVFEVQVSACRIVGSTKNHHRLSRWLSFNVGDVRKMETVSGTVEDGFKFAMAVKN